MGSESILNLIWAALCLMAMAALLPQCRRSCHRGSLARLRWDSAFLLIIVASFFCISASDDMIRMRALLRRLHRQHHSKHKPVSHLARLLDLQEDVKAATVYALVPALHPLEILALVSVSGCQRFLPSPAGRSPPFLPAVL